MSRLATGAKWTISSLPLLCVAVVVLRQAHWIGNGAVVAIFLVSLIPLATAKAFLELRKREEHEKHEGSST